jgi:hypothetical protein
MTDLLELIRKYEPVLRFSKDEAGEPEVFFPMAASDFVHGCGLRRRKKGWEHLPGETLLKHLGAVPEPGSCYLAYAAGDLPEGDGPEPDILLELMDHGLELSRGSVDAARLGLEGLSGDGILAPRMLMNRQRADDLEQQLTQWGEVERRPLAAQEMTALLGEAETLPSTATLESAFDLSFSSSGFEAVSDAPPTEADLELAAANLEWFVPRGLAALPGVIRQRAQEKYEPYREWGKVPPIYHYHVCQDGGYRVLQYWFLYAYNDWATHGGHNDHEGDWEVIFVFLDDKNKPQHVAYSRHVSIPLVYEPSTARWADVQRVKGSTAEATHAVVYVGCGSHASYLSKGKHPILWLLDYAEGDDVSIGPGTDQPWGEPVRLTYKPWNVRFSGNWGSLVKSWLGRVLPGTEGPTGPAQKGDKWRRPARWAGIAPRKNIV